MNNYIIPWKYTGKDIRDVSEDIQLSHDKYYFKSRYNYIGNNLYHGPLYLYNDGSYRSNNSREANMMYQKGLLDTKTEKYPKFWNSPHASLPVIASPSDSSQQGLPVDKFYRLIVIHPIPNEKNNTISASCAYPGKGKILYFRWDNSKASGPYVAGGSINIGIIKPINKITWVTEQTNDNYQTAFNLGYCTLVKQRRLYKFVYNLIKKRNKRIQLKALGKSASKWTIRNLNTVRINNHKTRVTPSIIRSVSFFGSGANNIRYRITAFL